MSAELEEVAEYPRADEASRDGIAEDDNPIPMWFQVTFGLTIVFAVFYAPYYLFSGWSQAGQYEEEVAAALARADVVRASLPTTNPFRGDAGAIAEGKVVYEQICSVCHKPDGSGLVGPSLVDPYWKYGHDDETLYETVSKGRPLGMPAWGAQLGSEKIWKALAYLETLPKSDQPGVGAPDSSAAPPGS